jgi:putative FmdB family regulatory protein
MAFMPVYEYEHIDEFCARGKRFDLIQSMKDQPLTICPTCGKSVRKRITTFGIQSVKSNSELKDSGFVKLVKRADGNYENVTATGSESRIWDPSKPETLPDLKKRNLD